MNHPWTDPEDCPLSDEYAERKFRNRARVAMLRGDYDTLDELEDTYSFLKEESDSSTESFAPSLPIDWATSHTSPSRRKTTTRLSTTSLSSAKFNLSCATGKLSKSSSQAQQKAAHLGGSEG